MHRMNANPPSWMLSFPKPDLEKRLFNGHEQWGWIGLAPIQELIGWVQNPRIEFPLEKFKETYLRDPNIDDLLEIMIDTSYMDKADREDNGDNDYETSKRKNTLLQLAENIRLNRVRTPLVATFERKILDGNRRYFASLYLLQQLDKGQQKSYQNLPVWVLVEETSKETEELILTELNSIDDCRVKWPYSVVAKKVYDDHVRGMSIEELKNKYHDWTTSRINTVIAASSVAQEFIEYHEDAIEAKDIAYRKLIWFDELQRSNRIAMTSDEFRHGIFDLIMRPNSPFSNSAEFKGLGEIYHNPEAWEHLTTHDGKEALSQAKFIVQRERYEGNADALTRMKRVNSLLQGLATDRVFGLVAPQVLAEFHDLSEQVPDPRTDAEAHAEKLTRELNNLTSKLIAQLPVEVLTTLGEVLKRVDQQASSYREG